MKEYGFEEKNLGYLFKDKDTWVKLDLNGIKFLWDSNQIDYRKWPDSVSKPVAKIIAEFSKTLPEEQKLEMFFHAKGIAIKGRLFKELFRGLNWPYSDEERKYIETTKTEALEYYERGIINF